MEEYTQIKNGQYFVDEKQGEVYETIVKENPIQSVDYKWDEISLAELFALCYRDLCAFCPETKSWLYYTGKVWKNDASAIFVNERLKEFSRILELYAKEIEGDYEGFGKDFVKFVKTLGSRTTRDRVLKDAQGGCIIPLSEFDKDPYLINCKNGTYNLKDGKLKPHSPKDRITMITDCVYKYELIDTKFKRWNSFIDEITLGDKSIGKYLQKSLGYSLLGLSNEECMFIAFGKTTRNGKGTLLNTIQSILGDYATSISADFICANKNTTNYSQADPMLANLKGIRLLTLSETDENARLDERVIKNYTGGDPISTRKLYGEPFTFTPQFKIWLSCNHLPVASDKSLFSSDRLKVINFEKHFSENERDKTLKRQFLEERAKSIIFQWLLDGFALYQKEGLKAPSKVKEAVNKYENENNRVKMFIEETCEIDEEARVDRKKLYDSYKLWCKRNGYMSKSSNKFYADAETMYQKIKYQGVFCFKGIKFMNSSNITLGG